MKITKIWVVRDPSPVSEIDDILFEVDVDRLMRIFMGTGQAQWRNENTTLYTEAGEAKKDAKARMQKRKAAKVSEPHYVLMNADEEESKLDAKGFEDFLKDNEFDSHTEKHLRALKPGETYRDGGGAAPDWSIKRVASMVDRVVHRAAQGGAVRK